MEKPKCKHLRLTVEIIFEEPIDALGLNLNALSWAHAVKDVTKHYLEDSIDSPQPATINISALMDGAAVAAHRKALLN
jgi:hypothetical protein